MKTLLLSLIAFVSIGCSRSDNTPEEEINISTSIPVSYHGNWDIYEFNNGITQGASANPISGFSVKFRTDNFIEVVTPQINYTGKATYKKNGTSDSFTAENSNKLKLIINASDKSGGGKIMTLNFTPLEPNNYNYTLTVKKQ